MRAGRLSCRWPTKLCTRTTNCHKWPDWRQVISVDGTYATDHSSPPSALFSIFLQPSTCIMLSRSPSPDLSCRCSLLLCGHVASTGVLSWQSCHCTFKPSPLSSSYVVQNSGSCSAFLHNPLLMLYPSKLPLKINCKKITFEQLNVDGRGCVAIGNSVGVDRRCYGAVVEHQLSWVIAAAKVTEQQTARADLVSGVRWHSLVCWVQLCARHTRLSNTTDINICRDQL